MQLSPHFSLEEFTESYEAVRHDIDNTLPVELLTSAMQSALMMEKIRAKLTQIKGVDVPIIPTSGYRCGELNAMVGSKPTSDHPKAHAWDWKAPSFGSPLEICKALEPFIGELGIGQLIHEFGTWVHTSDYPVDDPVNRVITIDRLGTRAGLQPVR
jgi:zinc D-Ala-D-Ala carboxypeptidase